MEDAVQTATVSDNAAPDQFAGGERVWSQEEWDQEIARKVQELEPVLGAQRLTTLIALSKVLAKDARDPDDPDDPGYSITFYPNESFEIRPVK